MPVNVLGDTLWERWYSESNTLDKWNIRFKLVQQEIKFPVLRESSMKITELNLLAVEEQNNAIMEYKTPFKRRLVPDKSNFGDVPDLVELLGSTSSYVDDVRTDVLVFDLELTVQVIKDIFVKLQTESDTAI